MFTNDLIDPVDPDKPHIVFIGGFWRVSSKPKLRQFWAFGLSAREKTKAFPVLSVWNDRWNKAHQYIAKKNYLGRE